MHWTSRNHKKTLEINNWTKTGKTGKGTYTRALCQKNEGSLEIKISSPGPVIYGTK
jgi:hypothetical protein